MEKDVRIILASFNATWARRVFCAVSRINLYGGRYQWILAGPRQERWWREEDPTVNCTSYEILAALEGAFVVDVLPLASSKEVTISGLVSSISTAILTPPIYRVLFDQEKELLTFPVFTFHTTIHALSITSCDDCYTVCKSGAFSNGPPARARRPLHDTKSTTSRKERITSEIPVRWRAPSRIGTLFRGPFPRNISICFFLPVRLCGIPREKYSVDKKKQVTCTVGVYINRETRTFGLPKKSCMPVLFVCLWTN